MGKNNKLETDTRVKAVAITKQAKEVLAGRTERSSVCKRLLGIKRYIGFRSLGYFLTVEEIVIQVKF